MTDIGEVRLHRPATFDDPKVAFDLIPVFVSVFGAESKNVIRFLPLALVFSLWHTGIFC